MKAHKSKEEAFDAAGWDEQYRSIFYSGWYAAGNEINQGLDCDDATPSLATAEPAPAAHLVPIPVNEDQAAGMALVGEAWLREHAPHRHLGASAGRGGGLGNLRFARALRHS